MSGNDGTDLAIILFVVVPAVLFIWACHKWGLKQVMIVLFVTALAFSGPAGWLLLFLLGYDRDRQRRVHVDARQIHFHGGEAPLQLSSGTPGTVVCPMSHCATRQYPSERCCNPDCALPFQPGSPHYSPKSH